MDARTLAMRLRLPCLLFVFGSIGAWGQVQNLTFFKLPGTTGMTTADDCFVNEAGTAAASIYLDQTNRYQSYQLRKGTAEILQDLPGYTRSTAHGINGKGEVLGKMTGPAQFDFAVVVWRDKIPTKVVLPPLSDPANRQLATPLAIDDAGRMLIVISELTPAFQQTPNKYYLLNGGNAAVLPALQPGGAITAVYSFHYAAMNNAGKIAGYAMVTRLGQLQVIGFVMQGGAIQEFVVDQLFRVTGMNQKGEVFGERYDGSFFVWKDGEVKLFPRLMVSTAASAASWTNKGESCARVRVHANSAASIYENAIVSFDTKGAGQ